jgi:uncharacterized protein DUF551
MTHCKEWISVKDRLPEHHQVILVYKSVPSNTGYLVSYFIDSKKMNDELMKKGFYSECVDSVKHPYYFASREQQYFTIKDVTHWMELPEPPK